MWKSALLIKATKTARSGRISRAPKTTVFNSFCPVFLFKMRHIMLWYAIERTKTKLKPWRDMKGCHNKCSIIHCVYGYLYVSHQYKDGDNDKSMTGSLNTISSHYTNSHWISYAIVFLMSSSFGMTYFFSIFDTLYNIQTPVINAPYTFVIFMTNSWIKWLIFN